MTPVKRVIIDCDPGVDDAAALLFALASPELNVEAVTTVYGNGSVDACTANALRILAAAGRSDIPVYRGAGRPLLRQPNPGWASQVHGGDVLGNLSATSPEGMGRVEREPAAVEIVRRINESPGKIALLALGRMTNVALALSLEPQLAEKVGEVVVMGGAVFVPGNVSPVATANLYEDPEAAAILYHSGAPVVQVGLDVCDRVEFSKEQLERVSASDNAGSRLLAAATPFLQGYYRSRGLLADPAGVRYNDVPAVAYAVNPGWFETRDLYVTVDYQGPATRGQTVADVRGVTGMAPNASVCLGVDVEGLTGTFIRRVAGEGDR